MKRIIIISSFAATALFTLTGGVQAQNSIEQVLKNIETNNKELQANAQLLSRRTGTQNGQQPARSYLVLRSPLGSKGQKRNNRDSSFRRVSTSPACMPRAIN